MNSKKIRESLSDHMIERIHVLRDTNLTQPSLVLYWMCTAVRSDENPALNIAVQAANLLGVPILVYQGLSYRYPFANDRHHRFIMEGARDVQLQLKNRNIPYVFHLEHPKDPAVLKILANMASLVITENMPTPPLRRWRKALYRSCRSAMWSVDTACILPLSRSSKKYTRAYHFADDFKKEREHYIHVPQLDVELAAPATIPHLPFQPIDLQYADIDALLSQVPIDHSIPPVHDTKGGSHAGYQRWKSFLRKDIDRYHYTRNHPNQHGSSRLSAYLHYGYISPFRIARE